MFKISHLDHVALTVSDPKRSADWYRKILGLEFQFEGAWPEGPIAVGTGTCWIALFGIERPPGKPSPDHDTIALRHFAFRVSAHDFQEARRWFSDQGVAFHFEDHGIAQSVYLRDPDGHEVELTTYLR